MSAETDSLELEETPESVDSPESVDDSGLDEISEIDEVSEIDEALEIIEEETVQVSIRRELDNVPVIAVIEAALMAAGKPLTLEHLAGLFDDSARPSKPELKHAMISLSERCADRGFELKEIASGWRFQVRQELVHWVGRLWDEKPQRYTRALLETLSLVAYRQPITRGEIEDIRGVSVSTNIVRTLQEREWVRVVGHRDVPGRPAMYATTRQFLDYFNLRNLDELPPLSELRDLDEMARKLEGNAAQPELALDENGEAAGNMQADDKSEEEKDGESAEKSASRLVSVEEAQAFQEEGDGNIEQLFSELDNMEDGLTLTYTDYSPHVDEDTASKNNENFSEDSSVDAVQANAETSEEEHEDNCSPSSDEGLESDDQIAKLDGQV